MAFPIISRKLGNVFKPRGHDNKIRIPRSLATKITSPSSMEDLYGKQKKKKSNYQNDFLSINFKSLKEQLYGMLKYFFVKVKSHF